MSFAFYTCLFLKCFVSLRTHRGQPSTRNGKKKKKKLLKRKRRQQKMMRTTTRPGERTAVAPAMGARSAGGHDVHDGESQQPEAATIP